MAVLSLTTLKPFLFIIIFLFNFFPHKLRWPSCCRDTWTPLLLFVQFQIQRLRDSASEAVRVPNSHVPAVLHLLDFPTNYKGSYQSSETKKINKNRTRKQSKFDFPIYPYMRITTCFYKKYIFSYFILLLDGLYRSFFLFSV